MKLYPHIEQGSEAWYRLRAGRPTASNFDKIITPKTMKISASAQGYALRLVAERLLKSPLEMIDGNLPWMERGKELEPAAVKQYEFAHEVKTVPVGFITMTEEPYAPGCSPDRLVLDPKNNKRLALEVKCPSPHVHLGYLLNGQADEYKPQVQGQILIAQLDRADFYSFHPRMPEALIQTYRDDEYVEKLEAVLGVFGDLVASLTERADKLGVYQAIAAKDEAEGAELSQVLQRAAADAFPYEGA